MKKGKQLIALVLTVAMIFSLCIVPAFADVTTDGIQIGNKYYTLGYILGNEETFNDDIFGPADPSDVIIRMNDKAASFAAYLAAGGDFDAFAEENPATPNPSVIVNPDGSETPVEEPGEELEVVSVSAINPAQIKIVFNKAVDESTIKLENFYLGLTKDVTNNIKKHNQTGYTVELLKDEKTVIISGANLAANVIWEDENTGTADALKTADGPVLENRTVYVQIKDIKTKDGKLASAMEGSFVAKDEEGPKFAKTSYTVEKVDVDSVAITFNEPVVFENLGATSDKKAEFYLNGTNVTTHVDYVTPAITGSPTVEELSTIVVDLSAAGMELDANNNTFEVVGLQDLAGNATVPGRITTKIEVKEKDDTVTAPKVVGIEQVHDAAFIVVFDKALSNTTDGTITIKNLLNDNKDAVYGLGYAAAGGGKAELVAGYTNEDYEDAVAYQVVFDVDLTDGDEAYKGANEIIRTIVVEGYKVTSASGTDYKGAKYSKAHKFVKDNKAPIVKGYKIASNDVVVEFYDPPFNGAIKEGVEGDIIVKYVEDGITYTYDSINVNPLTAITGNEVKLGLTAANAEKLFKADGTIKPGITFTVKLPYGLVQDDKTDVDTPQYNGPFDFIGDTITVTTPGTAEQEVVPQTSQANIKFISSENLIKVGFVGDNIDPATVKNKANYTFDGKALPAGTTIEYSEKDADDTDVNAKKVAYIYLPKNSVVRNGNYQLTIKNVATKGGAKMLPTEVTVYGVTDNTQPVMTGAVVTSDNTVEVTFNETLDVTPQSSVTNAERNFYVVINGVKFNVASVTAKTTRTLVITTADTFDYNLGVKVQIVNDASNDMFVKDVAGNAAAEGIVTATIDIQ